MSGTSLGHSHYSQRTQLLRALLLGVNDGLVSVAALLMGISSGSNDNTIFALAGISAIVAGSLSMACGEYISVASQKDSQKADIQKEVDEQNKGPEAQLQELNQLKMIYVNRGLTEDLALEVAKQLTEIDVIKAHARDEHNIDLDELDGRGSGYASPMQAAAASALSFVIGGIIPFLSSLWVSTNIGRMITITIVTAFALISFGALGAHFGGSSLYKGGFRVLFGGLIALAISFGIGQLFHVSV